MIKRLAVAMKKWFPSLVFNISFALLRNLIEILLQISLFLSRRLWWTVKQDVPLPCILTSINYEGNVDDYSRTEEYRDFQKAYILPAVGHVCCPFWTSAHACPLGDPHILDIQKNQEMEKKTPVTSIYHSLLLVYIAK